MSPALHDDLLRIDTEPVRCSGSSFSLLQQIWRVSDHRLLVSACVKLACIGLDRKARRIPKEVRQVVAGEVNNGTI
jgi:acyl-CoA thioester hydrolase